MQALWKDAIGNIFSPWVCRRSLLLLISAPPATAGFLRWVHRLCVNAEGGNWVTAVNWVHGLISIKAISKWILPLAWKTTGKAFIVFNSCNLIALLIPFCCACFLRQGLTLWSEMFWNRRWASYLSLPRARMPGLNHYTCLVLLLLLYFELCLTFFVS